MANVIDFESIRSGKFAERNAQENPPELNDDQSLEGLADAAETLHRAHRLTENDMRMDDLNRIQDESVRRAERERREAIETRRKALEVVSDEVREELTDQVVSAVKDALYDGNKVRLPNGQMIVRLDKPVVAGSGDQVVTIPAGFISVPTKKDGTFPPSLFDASREVEVIDADKSWLNDIYDFDKNRFRDLNEKQMNIVERMLNTGYLHVHQGLSSIKDKLTRAGVNPAKAADKHATLYDHTYSGEVFRKAQQVDDWSAALKNQQSPVGTLEEMDVKTSRDAIGSLREMQEGLGEMDKVLRTEPSTAHAYEQWLKHSYGARPVDQFKARKAESTLENVINRDDALSERLAEQMERVRQASDHLNGIFANDAQRDAVVKMLSGPLNGEFKHAYSPGETLKLGERMGRLMGGLQLENESLTNRFSEALDFFKSDNFASMMNQIKDFGKEIAEAIADLVNKIKAVFGADATA